ncbi:MAG: NAD+ synthase, partial [Candidatus Electrothrix sp. EH2]|nr:NAD+ synthase [Candidatus Electrothrix sp. EH2]
MKTALAQCNPIVGNFSYNRNQIVERIRQAEKAACDLIIFPELTLCGYPPQDLLERPAFLRVHDRALEELIASAGEIGVILGVPEQRRGKGKQLYNSAILVAQGKVVHRVRKQLLPAYDVFDESRYFEPGPPSPPFSFQGLRIGLTVCEDIWPSQYPHDPVASFVQGHDRPDILINISASPYHHGKLSERNQLLTALCRENQLPLLYVNQVGGQDSLIFDGHSMALNNQGELYAAALGFAEDLLVLDTEELAGNVTNNVLPVMPDEVGANPCIRPCIPGRHRGLPLQQTLPEDSIAQMEKALVLGIRDYLHKTGFQQADHSLLKTCF